jgi:hypothetical protein
MTRFVNQYPPDWPLLKQLAKNAAGNRCVRCHHPFTVGGTPLACDVLCDHSRGRARDGVHDFDTPGLNFGVHHLDGDKGNSRWWNLLPLDNSCHLTIQAKVVPEQGYMHEHSAWFLPFVAGFYAWKYGGLETTRAEVEADLERFLAFGQPHLYATAVTS